MISYDFLVIGSGPAGQRAAVQAAKLGKKVAIIERRSNVGGVSVHTGTIPSKTLKETVLYLTGWNQRGLYGHDYRLKQDITIDDLMQRLNITLQHEIEVMRHQLARNGVDVIEGIASFIDAHRLKVESPNGDIVEYQGEKMLIAVGSRPVILEDIPFNNETIIDSDGILDLKALPRSMIVVGAGVIGVEYASMFAALDIDVTLINNRSTLLEFLDREIVNEFVQHLKDNGVTLLLNETVSKVEESADGEITTHLGNGEQLNPDLILFATGRMGCTYALEPKNAGIDVDDRRRIKVNEYFQTSTPHIYAAGDVIGFPSLASTSMEQGRLAACYAFNHPATCHPANFPFGVYAIPEMSMVGMMEQELIDKNIPYEKGIARLRETARGQIMGLEEGMLKLLIGSEDHRLLGVHIIGEGATELIHIGQAVLVLGGTLEYFLENVFNYPTLAEAYKVAALDAWNRVTRKST